MSTLENSTSIASTVTSTLSLPSAQLEKSTMWFVMAAMFISMITLTVLGNVLVLITTWLDKRLHQPNKYFIACLAVADLLVGIFGVPIRLYLHFNITDLMKVQLCRFWTWIDIFCEVASINTLTIISIDRYLKISEPFKYRSKMTTSRSFIVIFFIWLISAVVATLGVFSYGGSQGVSAFVGRGCINDNVVYITILAVCFFFLPTLITVIMYGLIFCTAHKRQKMTRKGALGESFGQKQRGKVFQKELKTIRILLLVVSTFIICWGPFFTYFLLLSYLPSMAVSLGPQNVKILGSVFIEILPSFNSLCNPIIYACFDREYSKAFKHLFQRKICFGTSPRKATKLTKSSSTQSSRLKECGSRGTSTSFAGKEIRDNCRAETRLL